jgi:hypothetical protein
LGKLHTLRIDNDGLSVRPRQRNQVTDQRGRQKSLGIIRDHQHVVMGDGITRGGKRHGIHRVRPRRFLVGAHHLLLIRDIADFFRAARIFQHHQRIIDGGLARQKLMDVIARGVFTPATDQCGPSTQ